MKIMDFKMYLDGGTIKITTDKGIYFIDDRINSTTKGRLYNGYPKEDNSNLIINSENLEKELIENLKNYKNDFYQKQINYLIESKKI